MFNEIKITENICFIKSFPIIQITDIGTHSSKYKQNILKLNSPFNQIL